MMKRIGSLLVALALVLGLCACGKSAQERWQEQYDLGMKYLSELNYEEAVAAFTEAIYIGRGDPAWASARPKAWPPPRATMRPPWRWITRWKTPGWA